MTQYNLAANPPVNNLITDIKSLIQGARSGLAATVNAEKSLRQMVRFAEVFASEEIVSAVRRPLSCRI